MGHKLCDDLQPFESIEQKDCDFGTKPSYRENLGYAHQIWDVYQWLHFNLDVSFQHFDEYKVFKRSVCVMQYSLVFTFIINPCCCFTCCVKIRGDIEACSQHP